MKMSITITPIQMQMYTGPSLRSFIVGRIDYHVLGTKPNADSAFAEYILYAHTRT
jgi:hypothetical protein